MNSSYFIFHMKIILCLIFKKAAGGGDSHLTPNLLISNESKFEESH